MFIPVGDCSAATRMAVAVAASLAVHATTLVLPAGVAGPAVSEGMGRDPIVLRLRDPEPVQPEAVVLPPVESTIAAPPVLPSPQLPSLAVVRPPARESGVGADDFGYSMLQAAPDELRLRAWEKIVQSGGVAAEAVASMTSREQMDVGYSETWRGRLRVVAAAIIAADGSIEDAIAVEGDEAFTAYALAALRRAAFEPARRDGEPARGYAVITIDFCPPGSSASCPDQPAAAPDVALGARPR